MPTAQLATPQNQIVAKDFDLDFCKGEKNGIKPDLHVAFNNMTMLLRAQIEDKFKTKQKPIVMMVM